MSKFILDSAPVPEKVKVLPIKLSFAHKVVVFKQQDPETTYIPIDVIDIGEYKLNELNITKPNFQQILNTISVLTKNEDIINIQGNYIEGNEGKYFDPENIDFFTNFIRKDKPQNDKIEQFKKQLKKEIEGNKQTSSIMENLKETKDNMDKNIESAIEIAENSEQLEDQLKDELTKNQTDLTELTNSKYNEQEIVDKQADLVIKETEIIAEIEEVDEKAEIEAQEIIDKANAHRKKMLEQIKELDNKLNIRKNLETLGFINKPVNKPEKSERSEDTDDIEIKIDNIHVKYPYPWEEIYQILIYWGYIDDKLIVGGKGPFYNPPYYLVVLNDQKTPTNIIPLNYQGKVLFDIKMYIHNSGIKIGETRIILGKIASYFNNTNRFVPDIETSQIKTNFLSLNTIYEKLLIQKNIELDNANNAILTLEKLSKNLQDRKEFFYYIIFLREKIMNFFKKNEVIDINDTIEPLKNKYLLSNKQQLDYKKKYENYIKHENRVNYSKTNETKTNKPKSLKHNKTTKVR